MVTEARKSEAEVMFPAISLDGYQLRPWTWDQLISVLPDVMGAMEKVETLKINFNQIEAMANDPERKTELFKLLVPVLIAVGPIVPNIIAKTIDEDLDKIKSWDAYRILNMALVIAVQNASRIKNSVGLVASQLEMIGPRPLLKQ